MEKINLERSAKVRLLENHFGEIVIQCKLDEFDTADYFNNLSLGYIVYNNKQCFTELGDLKYDIGFYQVVENFSETHEFLGYKWKMLEGGGSGGGGGLELVSEMPFDLTYAGKTVLYIGPETEIGEKTYYTRHIYLGSIIEGALVWADISAVSVNTLMDVEKVTPTDNSMLMYSSVDREFKLKQAYPPTTPGESGQVWVSKGYGEGEWSNAVQPRFMTLTEYNRLSSEEKEQTWAIIYA